MDRGWARAINAILLTAAILLLGGCTSRTREIERAQRIQQANPPAALAIYQSLLRDTPASHHRQISTLNYHLGECYWKLQHPAEAFAAYQRAAEADDDNAAAHVRLAELYVAGGALASAIQQGTRALKVNPQFTDAWAALASAYIAAGDPALAIDALQHVLALEPQRSESAVELADLYNREGRLTDARRVLLVTTEAQKGNATAWLALGRLEEQQGDVIGAESAYRKAVAAENTTETNRRLAQFLERTSRLAEAELVLQELDGLHLGLPSAAADFAFTSGHADRALKQYSDALAPESWVRKRSADRDGGMDVARLASRAIEAQLSEAEDGSGPPANNSGTAARSKAAQQARATLDEFRRYLDAATIAVLEAEISLAEGDLLSASLRASAAIALADDSAPAHYILGVSRMRSGDTAGARAEWETALQNDSEYIPANIALAQLLLQQRQYALAEQHAAAVIRDEPANLRALLVYANTLLAERQLDAATSIANRALRVSPLSGEAHLILGRLALLRSNSQAAVLEFQQAVMLQPDLRETVERLMTGDHGARSALQQMEKLEGKTAHSELNAPYASRELSVQSSAIIAAVRAQESGDYAHAVEAYEFAIGHGDVSGLSANNLAWILAEQGEQLDRALQLAQMARQQDPKNPAVLDTLGVVHLRRREYSKAIDALKTASRLAAEAQPATTSEAVTEAIQEHLAQALRLAGEPQTAARLQTPEQVRPWRTRAGSNRLLLEP